MIWYNICTKFKLFWSSNDVVVPYLFYGMLRKYKIRFISKPAVTADFVALVGFSAYQWVQTYFEVGFSESSYTIRTPS